MRFTGNGITNCYPDQVDNFVSIPHDGLGVPCGGRGRRLALRVRSLDRLAQSLDGCTCPLRLALSARKRLDIVGSRRPIGLPAVRKAGRASTSVRHLFRRVVFCPHLESVLPLGAMHRVLREDEQQRQLQIRRRGFQAPMRVVQIDDGAVVDHLLLWAVQNVRSSTVFRRRTIRPRGPACSAVACSEAQGAALGREVGTPRQALPTGPPPTTLPLRRQAPPRLAT